MRGVVECPHADRSVAGDPMREEPNPYQSPLEEGLDRGIPGFLRRACGCFLMVIFLSFVTFALLLAVTTTIQFLLAIRVWFD
jgi:hypothetical protein